MAFKLPWSNFHELNLDWVLEKMKELSDKVDAFIGSAVPSNDPPVMDGTASAGSSVNYARGDHVHPTDTTRASQSYAQSIEDKVDDLDHNCEINFREINDILNFSTASPLVDGVANPGTSQYPARADHVHPTDTSRASKSEFDTLKATVDAWGGAASPYGSLPNMDGAASAGSIDAYSRGDHVHPSDTSKLDVAGGTITGDLDIEGQLLVESETQFTETAAVGWLRVCAVPDVAGTKVSLTVCKNGEDIPSETHSVDFTINRTGGKKFSNEQSVSDSVTYITAVRYSDAGYLDIRMDQAYASVVGVSISKYAPDADSLSAIEAVPIEYVDDAPAGETILATYNFLPNTTDEQAVSALGKTWTFLRNGPVCAILGAAAIGQALAVGSRNITTLPAGWRPKWGIQVPITDNPTIDNYVSIQTNGAVKLIVNTAMSNGDACAVSGTWVNYQ